MFYTPIEFGSKTGSWQRHWQLSAVSSTDAVRCIFDDGFSLFFWSGVFLPILWRLRSTFRTAPISFVLLLSNWNRNYIIRSGRKSSNTLQNISYCCWFMQSSFIFIRFLIEYVHCPHIVLAYDFNRRASARESINIRRKCRYSGGNKGNHFVTVVYMSSYVQAHWFLIEHSWMFGKLLRSVWGKGNWLLALCDE